MGPIHWEVFKKMFLDRFIPQEMKEVKVEEFINLFKEVCVFNNIL